MIASGKNGQNFNSDQLYEALRNVEDLMDRLLTPYFLLKKTAYDVKHDRYLEGDGIDVGIRSTAFTQYMYDILKEFFGFTPEEVNKGFEYKVGEVPVRIKVYFRNYHFFKYPDTKVYQYGTYLLPNPWDIYWKSRFLIR